MAKKFLVISLTLLLALIGVLYIKKWRQPKVPLTLQPESITARTVPYPEEPALDHFNVNLWINGQAVFDTIEHCITDTNWGMDIVTSEVGLISLVCGVMACNEQGWCRSDTTELYKHGQDNIPGPTRDVSDPRWYVLSETTWIFCKQIKNKKDAVDFRLPSQYHSWHWSPSKSKPLKVRKNEQQHE
jgi:hypothetical protein